MHGLSGSSGKGFDTLDEAQRWLHAVAYPVGAVPTTVVSECILYGTSPHFYGGYLYTLYASVVCRSIISPR